MLELGMALPAILLIVTFFYTQEYKFMLKCLVVGSLSALYPLSLFGLILGLPSICVAVSILGLLKYNNKL